MKRFEIPEHARYLTCSCYQRLALFNNHKIMDAFVEHLAQVKSEMRFRLYAWVVMPEHFHLLLQPADESIAVSLIVRKLKSSFARRTVTRWRELNAPILPRITDRQGRVRFWQAGGGYDRNVYSHEGLEQKVRYTHANPVRRGLIERDEGWGWSSARWFLNRSDYTGPEIDAIRG